MSSRGRGAFGLRRSGKGGLPPSSMTTTKQKTFTKKTNLNERRKRSKRSRVKASDESDENESSSSSSMMNEKSMQEMLAKLERAEKEKELLQQKLEETNTASKRATKRVILMKI